MVVLSDIKTQDTTFASSEIKVIRKSFKIYIIRKLFHKFSLIQEDIKIRYNY